MGKSKWSALKYLVVPLTFAHDWCTYTIVTYLLQVGGAGGVHAAAVRRLHLLPLHLRRVVLRHHPYLKHQRSHHRSDKGSHHQVTNGVSTHRSHHTTQVTHGARPTGGDRAPSVPETPEVTSQVTLGITAQAIQLRLLVLHVTVHGQRQWHGGNPAVARANFIR